VLLADFIAQPNQITRGAGSIACAFRFRLISSASQRAD
jgi:hypothetical protein